MQTEKQCESINLPIHLHKYSPIYIDILYTGIIFFSNYVLLFVLYLSALQNRRLAQQIAAVYCITIDERAGPYVMEILIFLPQKTSR